MRMKGEGEIIMKYQEMVSNYELQADSARKLFLTYDQEKMIRRFHLEADAAWIYTEYLHLSLIHICISDNMQRTVRASSPYPAALIQDAQSFLFFCCKKKMPVCPACETEDCLFQYCTLKAPV